MVIYRLWLIVPLLTLLLLAACGEEQRVSTLGSTATPSPSPPTPAVPTAAPFGELQAFTIVRVSIAPDGSEANSSSRSPSISADGRFVAFGSTASNLVPSGTHNVEVFVHDLETGLSDVVTLATDGGQAKELGSSSPSISADGRSVAFVSYAYNLVPGDTNEQRDIFVRVSGVTELVSMTSGGNQSNAYSDSPAISGDGRVVAFVSRASGLAGRDGNKAVDVFVHDRRTGVTELVSVSLDGAAGVRSSSSPSISADGRFVAFASHAWDLVTEDTNSQQDIFVRDMHSGVTERVSVASDGTQFAGGSASPSISADGRFVAFASVPVRPISTGADAKDDEGPTAILVRHQRTEESGPVGVHRLPPRQPPLDIFVHDRQTGVTERVTTGSEPYSRSTWPSISADGRFIAFQSNAPNLVSSDGTQYEDVFVHDRRRAATAQLSVSVDGTQGNRTSWAPSISADGRFVVFYSESFNLVPGDTNKSSDVFLATNPLFELENP